MGSPCGPAECVPGSRLSPRGVLPGGQGGAPGPLHGHRASGRGVSGPRKPLPSGPPWQLLCGGQEAQLERPEDAGLTEAQSSARRGSPAGGCGGPARVPRACGQVNSRARLWGLGAQAHPWLLSGRDFRGLRCCLGSPAGKRQLSYGRDLPRRTDGCGQSPARADTCPPSPVGPCLPRGAVRRHLAAGTERLGALRTQGRPACPPPAMGHHGRAAGARREHLPCFLLPRFPPGALCVRGGQGPPGRVWRNQPRALQMPAVGQDPGGAGGARFPSRVCGAGPPVWAPTVPCPVCGAPCPVCGARASLLGVSARCCRQGEGPQEGGDPLCSGRPATSARLPTLEP